MGTNDDHGGGAETLGRYRLLRRIAQGGMAEVFVGRSEGAHGFQKTVAVKRILPRYSGDQQFINMMVDEAKISVLLNHPNIAQIFEFGEQDGDYFIVMEYVPGQSLSKLVKRMLKRGGRLDVLEACFILVEVLQGLHAAHVQRDPQGRPARIVHRDVSPQNVLVSYDGQVKLIDFGIAKAKGRLERTEVGTIKGKLRYLAPEMVDPRRFADGVDFDHRVDVFAAGIVLYEIIAGRMLFSGENENDVYRAITDDEIPDLSLEGLCDEPLMVILNRALARPAALRYPSAEAFADELRAYVYRADPAFSRRRIADHMQTEFQTEYVETSRLDALGEGDVGDAPREVTFVARMGEGGDATRMGRRGSGRRPMPGEGSTGVQLVGAPRSGGFTPSSRSEPASSPSAGRSSSRIKDALPRVNPSAETQVVDPARLAALETVAGESPIDDRTAPSMPHVDDAPPAPRPSRTQSGAIAAAPSGSLAPARDDETGLTPATSRLRPPSSGVRWGAVIGLAAVVGVALAFGIFSVVLRDDAKDPGPTATPTGDGARPLLVDATPRGARVEWLGTPSGPADAPTVFFVKPGDDVVLRFTAPGFRTVERKVTIAPDEERPKVEVALEAEPVALRVVVKPDDAAVTVDGKAYASGQSVTPGVAVRVAASASGYVSVEEAHTAEPGRPLEVRLTLERDDTSSTKPGKKPPASATTKPPKRGKPGVLVVTSMPYWGRVTIDGRTLEETTPVRATLPPGEHEVVVEHPPQGLVKRFTVEIEPGKTLKRAVKF